ncbi:MAG TPA: sulfite exporter TauE/SafE family protein [Candidatus Sulfomarinibacteraceae bacterium]|nr:sulfite exporter TauE/SafE family protein [Candidatus Sulfomarinibacteraceae bacterium]
MLNWIVLAVAGFIAFIISTVAGGGGSLILVPIVSFYLGAQTAAPVISLANTINRPVRLVLFWKDIDWSVAKYYVPGGIAGALLGSYLFANLTIEYLQIIVGLFLISTVFQYNFGESERAFEVRAVHFLPLGFVVSLFSALIGATGPVLNPFYLNYGLQKEHMIGTKTVNSFLVGLTKIGSYTFFGALYGRLWGYGLLIGVMAGLASYVGKQVLGEISNKTFRILVIALMVISGAVMVYEQVSAWLQG